MPQPTTSGTSTGSRRAGDRFGRGRRIIVEVASLGLILVAAWFLWPVSLGGNTQMIAVQGSSMEPTYHTGDLLFVRSNDSPNIGDVVVFRIPQDEPGGGNLVVHRALSYREDGSIVTQGDNRDTADPFRVTEHDIVGTPRFVIPQASRAIGLTSTPLGLALIGGALVTLLLWPDKRREPAAPMSDDGQLPPGWRVPDIEDFMAEAEAWVEMQLAEAWVERELARS